MALAPPPSSFSSPPPPPPPLDPGGIIQPPIRMPTVQSIPPYLLPGSSHTFPKPKQKMKTLNWSKIPTGLVSGESIWNELYQDSRNIRLNFEQVEELFCQKATKASSTNGINAKGKLKREMSEISLLDPKRSLNINIFLKQFKGGEKQLVELIRNCRSSEIGAERLRTLLKLLPEYDEINCVKSFTGDKTKLGTAENFYLLLSEVKSYKIRAEGMIQVEEFQPNIDVLRPQIHHYVETCDVLLNSKSLKRFLKLVLVTGNFINAGSYAGNAIGFRLSTLSKLAETRANKPRMTLLHYLVDVAEKEDKEMLDFTEELKYLSKCARLSIDGLTGEVNQLKSGIKDLDKEIHDGDPNLKKYFGDFIKEAKTQLKELTIGIEEIKRQSSRLAHHFCEDEAKCKEECIIIFHNFCEKIKLVKRENEERKRQEERAERLRKQREEEQKLNRAFSAPEEEKTREECKRRKGRKDSKSPTSYLTRKNRFLELFRKGFHGEGRLGDRKKSA